MITRSTVNAPRSRCGWLLVFAGLIATAVAPSVAQVKDEAQPALPFVVHGTVTDRAGRPLPGVEVTANSGMGTLMLTGKTQTGADGRYTLRFAGGFAMARSADAPLGVGVQVATITPSLDGWYEFNLGREGDLLMAEKALADEAATSYDGFAGVVLPHKPYQLDFVMARGATIQGRLVNEFGRSIAAEDVCLDGPELPPSSSVLSCAETDKDGRFRFEGVPLGHEWFFSLRVHGIRHELTTPTIAFDKPQRRSYELTLDSSLSDDGAVQIKLLLQEKSTRGAHGIGR